MATTRVHASTLIIACLGMLQVHSTCASLKSAQDPARRSGGFMNSVKKVDLRDDLETAVEEALDHGHGVEYEKFQTLKRLLMPTYRALPKNDMGNLELHSLRNLAYRHFMQRHGISIKAFEPHQPLNGTELRAGELLQDRAPAYIEELLNGRFAHHGFALKDAIAVIATLERLLFDDSRRRLESAFESNENLALSPNQDVPFDQALEVLQTFFMTVVGIADPTGADFNEDSQNIAISELSRLQHERFSSGKSFGFDRAELFSFEELSRAAHGMVLASGSLYAHCDEMRDELAGRAKGVRDTGRVQLADFYKGDSGSDKFWFGESKEWLRKLGVLDESSFYLGPQVIVPNYMAAVPNCALSTPLYRVCCPNRGCEQLLIELERKLGRPSAEPKEILPLLTDLVAKLLDRDAAAKAAPLPAALAGKLDEIAEQHGGVVPLHGRLFAQVLHYAVPLECPFPHKRGSIIAETYAECGGQDCLVSDADHKEIQQHAEMVMSWDGKTSDDAWLSQWTQEEELISDKKTLHVHEPSADTRTGRLAKVLGGAGVLLLVFIFASVGTSKAETDPKVERPVRSRMLKSHLV